MRAAVVDGPDERVEIRSRETPDPGPNEVRIEVAACGVCGGDLAVIDGAEGIEYPQIPGHEIAGQVAAVGADVSRWEPGDRVAVGWHGGHCFDCEQCRDGRFTTCDKKQVTGITRQGGLAEYVLARAEAVAAVPDAVDLVDAGPLVCAGLTAYNALRNTDAVAGDLVAVQSVGGVGHMGLQFADAMGFETVALSRGTDKRDAAETLGADHYVDTETSDAASALSERGGAAAILATAPSAAAMESVVGGLAPDGEMMLVGAPQEPLSVDVGPMLDNRWTIRGWSAGHPGDAEDALQTAAAQGIEPWTESYELPDLERAVRKMTDSDVRFRAVIEP